MEVGKKELAALFETTIRTIERWQVEGMPTKHPGGNGTSAVFETMPVIEWYTERKVKQRTERLRKETEAIREKNEAQLEPGTIDYERYRLTKEQADAQELKNMRDKCLVVDTAFCTFALSRLANDIASVLDGITLAMQRRFPEMGKSQCDYLKMQVSKAMNLAARTSDNIPDMLVKYIELTDKQ